MTVAIKLLCFGRECSIDTDDVLISQAREVWWRRAGNGCDPGGNVVEIGEVAPHNSRIDSLAVGRQDPPCAQRPNCQQRVAHLPQAVGRVIPQFRQRVLDAVASQTYPQFRYPDNHMIGRMAGSGYQLEGQIAGIDPQRAGEGNRRINDTYVPESSFGLVSKGFNGLGVSAQCGVMGNDRCAIDHRGISPDMVPVGVGIDDEQPRLTWYEFVQRLGT